MATHSGASRLPQAGGGCSVVSDDTEVMVTTVAGSTQNYHSTKTGGD